MARKRRSANGEHTDQFQLLREAEVGLAELRARPSCVLVPVRDYNTLAHLDYAVRETDTDARDVVVLTIRLLTGPDSGVQDIEHEELFTEYEQLLFTRVVAVAERQGRSVKLLVVPSTNVFDAVAQTAIRLKAREIVIGESAKMTPIDQAQQLGEAWDRTPHDSSLATRLIVLSADGHLRRFSLGAHAPELSPEDIERIHKLWLDTVGTLGPQLHHRDIVTAALGALEDELGGAERDRAVGRLRRWLGTSGQTGSPDRQ